MVERQTELLKDLHVLNADVTRVLAKRKSWMDAHMPDFAKVQVGEEIYDLDSGKRLGVVSKLYRYWDGQRNPLYDTGMDVHYEFNTGSNIFDNTSRQQVRVGTKKDLDDEYRSRLAVSNMAGNWHELFGAEKG